LKVAIVYNPDAKGIINVFGIQNREWYPRETIARAAAALEKQGHEVELVAGDRFLLSKIKKFLPRISKRRSNGIVLNMALGIQGKARYTHVPAILEFAGLPYTGSSPVGHTLALDKVVAKQIFTANDLPTPTYKVFSSPDQRAGNLEFPLIVKPRGEAASFGIKVVRDEEALHAAVDRILSEFRQPVIVEEYIEGREVNVGVLGNNPARPLPVLELVLDDEIYSHDAKFANGKRKKVKKVCPADLPKETSEYIQDLAVKAFELLSIHDFARIDFRLDRFNRPFILEANSMASLNPGSSFVYAASKGGLSYGKLIGRIVEVAVERYAADEPAYFGKQVEEVKKNNGKKKRTQSKK
jgi:D-alanine-D-alanine ligase